MLTDEDRRLGNARAGAWLAAHGEGDALVRAEYIERGGELGRAALAYHRAAQQGVRRQRPRSRRRLRRAGPLPCAAGEPTLDGQAWRGPAHTSSRPRRAAGAVSTARRWRGRSRPCAPSPAGALPGGRPPRSWPPRPPRSATPRSSRPRAAPSSRRISESSRPPRPTAPRETGEERDDLAASGATSLSRAAVANFQRGHAAGGQDILARAEFLAARSCPDDPAAWAYLEMARGVGALVEGDVGRYLTSMRAARRALQARGRSARRPAEQANNVGNAYLQIGGYAEAERTLRDAIAEADRLGLTGERHSARVNLGLALGLQGRVAEGAAMEEEELALSQNPALLPRRPHLPWPASSSPSIQPAPPARSSPSPRRRRPPSTAATAWPCWPRRAFRWARWTGPGRPRGWPRICWPRSARSRKAAPSSRWPGPKRWPPRGDPGAARAAITAAEAQLLVQAARIVATPICGGDFLDNVPENARTLDLARAWEPVGEAWRRRLSRRCRRGPRSPRALPAAAGRLWRARGSIPS